MGLLVDPKQEQSALNINMTMSFEYPDFGVSTIDPPKEHGHKAIRMDYQNNDLFYPCIAYACSTEHLHIAIRMNCQYQM